MNLTPLRHTFGSRLGTNGCDLKMIIEIMGTGGRRRKGRRSVVFLGIDRSMAWMLNCLFRD
jgi:hypothetical protein